MSENVIAVLGDGESTRKNTTALLKDWSTPNRIDRILFNADTLSDAVRHVADWGVTNLSGEAVVAVVTEDTDQEDLTDYTDEGVIVLPVPDAVQYLIDQSTHLFLAWNSDDEESYAQVAEAALKQGVKVYDLTDGLFPIELDDSDDKGETAATEPEPEAAPEAASEPVEPPKAKAKSKAAKNAEKPVETMGTVPLDAEVIAQRAAAIVLERLAAALAK